METQGTQECLGPLSRREGFCSAACPAPAIQLTRTPPAEPRAAPASSASTIAALLLAPPDLARPARAAGEAGGRQSAPECDPKCRCGLRRREEGAVQVCGACCRRQCQPGRHFGPAPSSLQPGGSLGPEVLTPGLRGGHPIVLPTLYFHPPACVGASGSAQWNGAGTGVCH